MTFHCHLSGFSMSVRFYEMWRIEKNSIAQTLLHFQKTSNLRVDSMYIKNIIHSFIHNFENQKFLIKTAKSSFNIMRSRRNVPQVVFALVNSYRLRIKL